MGTAGGSPEASAAVASDQGTARRPEAESEQAGVSGSYTYWIEMVSLTVERDVASRQGTPTVLQPGRGKKVYIPAFAIDRGKYALRLKAWERDVAKKALSPLDKIFADRDLTIEAHAIDLARGFETTVPPAAGAEAGHFRYTVYGPAQGGGVFEAAFEITREPNQFATPTEADLALFDRSLIDVYFPDNEAARGAFDCMAFLGKRAAATLLDLIVIADRIFAKPRHVTTPDGLARISQPSSRFHKDYLEYQEGRITEDELIRRLPHVAMIGDSLTKNAYISSIPSMFWRIRTAHQNNWFLDAESSPDSIQSVYKRLEEFTPLVGVEYSGVGARVDARRSDQTFAQMLMKTQNFSGQVEEIVESERFPDLVLIWIGHNNLNWASPLSPEERGNPDKHLLRSLWRFRRDYARQLGRLVERAKKANHKSVIVAYGLVNFAAFFQARETAEALRAQDPSRYPYLERDYEIYESMRPEYRKTMIRLALMVNAELRDIVSSFNRELSNVPHVRVEYADALATVDISAVELIHSVDAWHPSVKGHNRLAEAAFGALAEPLQFLGIGRR